MKSLVAIIDYKMGNICSVSKALEALDASYMLTSSVEKIEQATHIILPGVGHFGNGMKELRDLGLVDALKDLSLSKPLLGICLGMQLLFKASEEAPAEAGLGLIDGVLKRFKISLPVPHVGWNEVYGQNPPSICHGIEARSNFYFVHSYYAELREDIPHTRTDYETVFVSTIQKGRIFGTQFHPEKSQKKGLALLKNFLGQA